MEKNQSFLSEKFQFLEIKFSIYMNRRVFVMNFIIFLITSGQVQYEVKASHYI